MLAATYLYLFSFVLFKWWHLQWGHINRTPNLAVHNLPVSEWAKSFLFFMPPDDVLNTSIVMSLWGRDSSICDPFCCNYTPSTKWDMTWVSIASSSLAVFFVWGFLFFWNHFNVFSAGHLSSLLLYEGLIFLIMTDEKREGVPDVMTRWKP